MLDARQLQTRQKESGAIKIIKFQKSGQENPHRIQIDEDNLLKVRDQDETCTSFSNPNPLTSGDSHLMADKDRHKESVPSSGKKRLRYSAHVQSIHPEHRAHKEKDDVLEDRLQLGFDDMRKQQRAGSLANFYQQAYDGEIMPFRKHFLDGSYKYQVLDGLNGIEQDKQEKAGSLANLYVPSHRYSPQEISPRVNPGVMQCSVTKVETVSLGSMVVKKNELKEAYVAKDKKDFQSYKKASLVALNANIINVKEAQKEESSYVNENCIIIDRRVTEGSIEYK